MGVQIADAAEALRLLVGGDRVTTYSRAASSTNSSSRTAGQPQYLGSGGGAYGAVSRSRGIGRQRRELRRGRRPTSTGSTASVEVTVFANLLPTASQAEWTTMQDEFKASSSLGYAALAGASKELSRAAQNFILRS
jgi:hypothetical protein